jgi:Concanavalin A-like lectin/glucanases superfamily/Secretion system C-terminal sorting domain/Calx-beta domain
MNKNFIQKMQNAFKIGLLCLGFMFSANTLLAQKIAVVGIDHSSPSQNGGDYDGISFVATENLVAGTIFYFTNAIYDAPNTRFKSLSSSDDALKFIVKYTVPAGGIAKGVVVYIQETNQTTNVLATTCSSGSCGTASFLVFNGAASNFSIGTIVMGMWAYSDTDDNPVNGITTIHSVLYEGYYDSGTGNSFFGNLPASMDPIGGFPNAIITDGITSALPTSFTTVEFKPSLRSGAVSKLNLEDPANYDKFVSTTVSLSTTAFANLNLVNANPTVGVSVSPSSVTENGAPNLVYTFTLSANATSNITVNYTATGTATNGTDYATVSGTVVIASGTNSVTVTVNPTGDATLEPDETVILTVVSGTGYDIGSPSSATGTITNDDTGTSLPKVALVGINHADQANNPSHLDGFSFVALEDIAQNTVVYFTRRLYDRTTLLFGNTYTGTVKWTAGTGVNRGDVYTVMETSTDAFTVTCSDGSNCGSATNLDAGFTIPSGGITMFAYTDNNDNPTDGVTEIYSALHTGDLTVGGNGGAIPTISNPASIYPNAVVIDNFPNAVPGKVEYDPTKRTVTVSRTALVNTANWLHAQSTATALSTVRFTNIIVTSGTANPLLSVAVSPTSVVENSGAGMVYTFTLSQNAASNITINFGVSGTATFTTDYTQTGASSFTTTTGSVIIPSGSNTASVTITPVADATLEPNETVVLTIDLGTGYDAGSPSVATGTIVNDDFRNVNPAVVIIGMNHGNASNPNPDGFSFVANQNLTAGTDIYFVDGLFDNTTLSFNTLEAVVKYTVPTGGLAKGQVVYIVETGATTNTFTVTCTAGSNCGTATYITQSTATDFSFASGGDNIYAYSDTDGDPTNGITDVYSLFYAINGTLPSVQNPATVFPNAVVVTGLGNASPDRTEYKFASSERSSSTSFANIQNTANYLVGQATQNLSVVPFAALNLCPASITGQPANAGICVGTNTTFTVAATGGSLTYQWQVNTGSGFTDISNGGIYSGATSAILTLTSVPIGNNGYTYQCLVNACATSNTATLTVNSFPNASITSVSSTCQNSSFNLSVASAGVGATYTWGGNGIVLANANSTTATPTSSGVQNYTVSITNSGNCTSNSNINVTVIPVVTTPLTTTNNVLNFDGTNDYVEINNCGASNPMINGGNELTIEYWFKGSSLQSAVRFQDGGGYVVAGWGGTHIISTDGGTATGVSVGAAATDGNWHHVAMTWKRNTTNGFKSYLDGQLVAQRNSANVALPIINANTYLGALSGTSEYINGSLDEVRVWNVERTQAQLQANANSITVPQAGLLAYYNFNHGTAGSTNTTINTLGNLAQTNVFNGQLTNFGLTGATTSNWLSASIPSTWNGSYWTNGTPTSSMDVIIASSTAPASFACKALTINSTYSLNTTGITVDVNGNITNNGNGISGTGTLNIAANSSISGNNLAVTGVLTVASGATLTTNNLLTLKSTSTTNTSQIGIVAGSITGNVTVERFIPAKRAYRVLAPGVTTSTFIRANWQEGTNNPNTGTNNNPSAGNGTHITGGTSANGFDVTTTNNPSLYTFNNGTQAWSAVTNTTATTLNAQTGYQILIRGDRSINLNSNTPTATNTTLRATGTVTTGTVNFTGLAGTTNNYSLLGNPYWAAVDWTAVSRTNIGTTYWIWDPTIAGTNGRGGYTSFTRTGVGTGTTSGGGSINKNIQPGQAFFVQTTAASPTLSFAESNKDVATALTSTFRTTGNTSGTNGLFVVKLFVKDNYALRQMADAATVAFSPLFSNGKDAFDAPKFPNPDESIGFKNGSDTWGMEAKAMPTANDTAFISMGNMLGKNYVLEVEGKDFDASNNLQAWLVDAYLNTKTLLSTTGSINTTYTIDDNASSKAANRFMIVLQNKTVQPQLVTQSLQVKITPNPASDVAIINYSAKAKGNTTIRIINANGQTISTTNLGEQQVGNYKLPVSKLAAGVYTVELMIGEERMTTQFVKQ